VLSRVAVVLMFDPSQTRSLHCGPARIRKA
jgi:hypothetical protein